MKLRTFTLSALAFFGLTQMAIAQNVGVGNAVPQARLDVNGGVAVAPTAIAAASPITVGSANLSALRITATPGVQTNVINLTGTPAEGQLLTVFNQDGDAASLAGLSIPAGGTADFIYLNGAWRKRGEFPGSAGWGLTGNAGTTFGTNFLGTTDAQGLQVRTANTERMQINAAGNVVVNNAATNLAGTNPVFRANASGDDISAGFFTSSTTTTGNNALSASVTAGTGLTDGTYSTNNSVSAFSTGLYARHLAATGQGYAVYGDISTTTNLAAGVRGDALGATGRTFGVVGTNSSITDFSAAAFGQSFANTGRVYGVYGTQAATTNFAAGARGDATGATGQTFGVQGTTASGTAGAVGVYGAATNASSTSQMGVQGSYTWEGAGVVGVGFGGAAAPPGANDIGVMASTQFGHGSWAHAYSNFSQITGRFTANNDAALTTTTAAAAGTNKWGVYAENYHFTNAANRFVRGGSFYANASATPGSITNGLTLGAEGFAFGDVTAAAGLSMGLRGISTNASAANPGYGVYGASSSVVGMGVLGYNSGTAATGTGVAGAGNNVASFFRLTTGSGVAGTGLQTGVYGIGTAAAGNREGGYFAWGVAPLGTGFARVSANNGGTDYKILGTGTVSTITPNALGSGQVTWFCAEAPEVLFQDYGRGQLVNGRATVQLDPNYAANIHVDATHPIRVFVQLEGDCKGVFVTNKTANGFEVVELQGGNSNVPFTYTVVANRRDRVENGVVVSRFQDVRFPAYEDDRQGQATPIHPYLNANARPEEGTTPEAQAAKRRLQQEATQAPNANTAAPEMPRTTRATAAQATAE